MSLLLWGIVGLLSGFLAYLIGPVLLAPVLGRKRMGDLHGRHAMLYLRRGLLVARTNGGLDVTASSVSELGSERAKLDGETKDWEDPLNRMSRLYTRPLGLASEELGIIVDPLLAEIGAKLYALYSAGEHRKVVEPVIGENEDGAPVYGDPIEQMAKYVAVDPGPALVNPLDVTYLIPGGADPESAEVARDYTEKSQEKFTSPLSTMQVISFIMAYGAAAVIVWFVMNYGDSAAANPTVIPGSLVGVLG